VVRRPRPAIRGSRPRARVLVGAVAAIAVACISGTAPPAVAAAGNSLSDGSVSPGTGSTETIFLFSVSYSSPRGFAATRVVMHVANQVIDMALVAGTADDGIYEASAQLPEGSWPVTFEATAVQGRSPTLAGPTVTVSPVPAATAPPPAPVPPAPEPPAPPPVAPAPLPPPVVPEAPVEAPAGDPAAGATSSASSSSGGSAAGVVVGTPGGESVPAALVDEGLPWTLVVAIGAIGLVVLAPGMLALARRRRMEETQPQPATASIATSPRTAPDRPARRLAEWELSALDDEPIGTVEYLGR
jgi:hypothetical protein